MDECAQDSLNSCDHICTNIEGGFTCSCRPGAELAADNITCNSMQRMQTQSQRHGYSDNYFILQILPLTWVEMKPLNQVVAVQVVSMVYSPWSLQYTCNLAPLQGVVPLEPSLVVL